MIVTVSLLGRRIQIDTGVPPEVLQKHLREVESAAHRTLAGKPGADRVDQLTVVVLELIERLYALEKAVEEERARLRMLARRIDRLIERIEEEISASRTTVDTEDTHLIQ